jgi:septal ring factor EnvC (AmiA/AmiB activator)
MPTLSLCHRFAGLADVIVLCAVWWGALLWYPEEEWGIFIIAIAIGMSCAWLFGIWKGVTPFRALFNKVIKEIRDEVKTKLQGIDNDLRENYTDGLVNNLNNLTQENKGLRSELIETNEKLRNMTKELNDAYQDWAALNDQ